MKTVLRALNNEKIKLESITKYWYSYKLNIERMYWNRNFCEGWEVDVYKNEIHLGSISNVDSIEGLFKIKKKELV